MMMSAGTALISVLLCVIQPGCGDTHSLYYLYTIQSKSSPDRIYDFSVVTLLDDRQIDFYNSTEGIRTPKQDWLKEMKESIWKTGTDKLKYDGQSLNRLLVLQIMALGHNESDGHTLQWRIGCEGGESSDGSVSVINCINEYGYDGEDLISYKWALKKWTASVSQAKKLEEEWNLRPGDRSCEACGTWLKIYSRYKTTDIKPSSPGVHVFVKKSKTDSNKLTLTCLVTGFYPKDVVVRLRKFTTSLPEHQLTSSGVRPNEDGTYQLRKSVKIKKVITEAYSCYASHSSLNRPVIKKIDQKDSDFQNSSIWTVIVGPIVGILTVLTLLGVFICFFTRRHMCVDASMLQRTFSDPDRTPNHNFIQEEHQTQMTSTV